MAPGGDAKWASSDSTRSAAKAHDMFLIHQSTTLKLGTPTGSLTGFGNIADPMSATKEGDEGADWRSRRSSTSAGCQACIPPAMPTSLAASLPYSVSVSICFVFYLLLHTCCTVPASNLHLVYNATYIPGQIWPTSTNQRLSSCKTQSAHPSSHYPSQQRYRYCMCVCDCTTEPGPSPTLSNIEWGIRGPIALELPLTPAQNSFRWLLAVPAVGTTGAHNHGTRELKPRRAAVWLAASVGFNIFRGPFSPSALWSLVMRYISN